MAKGSTQKGMRMIGPTLGHRVKQLEVKTRRTGGRYRSIGRSRSNSQIQQPLSILPDPRHPSIQGLAPTNAEITSEWVPWKGEFLKILLELEASPEPRNCTWIQQWTGDFYKESALHMTGVRLHLGHGGAPCPHAIAQAQQAAGEPLPMDDQEWEDVEDIEENPNAPLLQRGQDISPSWMSQSQTISLNVREAKHRIHIHVLDDFLRDNLECGTSSMNYYSKLCRITSSVFPHLVPVRFGILVPSVGISEGSIRIDTMTTRSAEKGRLALFCAACPQPGINVDTNEDLDHWQFTCTVVMDGNFKGNTCMSKIRRSSAVDGWTRPLHISRGTEIHLQQPQSYQSGKHSPGKASCDRNWGTACAWHGCFYLHCVVDFQKGERQLNMDYSLANALGYNMEGIKQVVCFYDINCSYMTNLRKRVGRNYPWNRHMACAWAQEGMLCTGAGWVDKKSLKRCGPSLTWHPHLHTDDLTTSQELLDFQMNDSNFMKMIRIVHAIELALLEEPRPSGSLHGAASWLACRIYLKLHLEAGSNTSPDYASDDGWLDDVGDELPASDGTLAGPQDKLPLPSTLGIDACQLEGFKILQKWS
ncbi:hypothetical protein BKA82DRAFT_4012959 [Pisolithus tinctorius]|nr:hypothetical protein BKA82DRAFT_4012959 [Pisolithus tinctorius]